jgi:ribosome-binding protein aMBF1 (putative translation factor)
MDIRARRIELGLSQWDTARRSNIHPADLSKIEAGRIVPYPRQAQRLARVLKVSVTEICTATRVKVGTESVAATAR